MALDIKPTRSELINLKRRIKQTSTGYNLLKMKRDGCFMNSDTALWMIEARACCYLEVLQAINLASSIESLAVKARQLHLRSIQKFKSPNVTWQS